MNALRNKVQLIGRVGGEPEVKALGGGRKVVNIILATNETYKNEQGEKIEDTQWHRLVAWGRQGEIIERYAFRGKEIAIQGKLIYRNFEDKNGEKRYITEIMVTDVLLLGRIK